jgi:hypothetical protein
LTGVGGCSVGCYCSEVFSTGPSGKFLCDEDTALGDPSKVRCKTTADCPSEHTCVVSYNADGPIGLCALHSFCLEGSSQPEISTTTTTTPKRATTMTSARTTTTTSSRPPPQVRTPATCDIAVGTCANQECVCDERFEKGRTGAGVCDKVKDINAPGTVACGISDDCPSGNVCVWTGAEQGACVDYRPCLPGA